MPEPFIEVYDTTTGQKLPNKVPANWLSLFPHLTTVPRPAAGEPTGEAPAAPKRPTSRRRRPTTPKARKRAATAPDAGDKKE